VLELEHLAVEEYGHRGESGAPRGQAAAAQQHIDHHAGAQAQQVLHGDHELDAVEGP
jgi:hypothetical protein